MTERFYDPVNGSDSNDGLTRGSPRRLVPGIQAGATAVSAGDIINVANWARIQGRLQPPANNLTYRGYGLGDEVLTLRLPARDPCNIKTVRVVREAGVDEGMWTLDGSGLGTSTIDVQNARTGVVIEDVLVLGDTAGSANAVTLGSSAAGTQSGITMRRFEIRGAGGKGLSCYKVNPLIEWFKISGTPSDGMVIGATSAGLYRAGTVDTVRYGEIIEPNINAAGELVGDDGDALQTLHLDGRFESRVVIHDLRIQKTTTPKQALLVCDALGGGEVSRVHIASIDGAQAGILLTCIRGDLVVRDNYVRGGCYDIPAVRLRAAETALAQLLATGASLRIINNVVHAPGGVRHFFDAAESAATLEMDGLLQVENNTVIGPVVGDLSYGAVVPLQGGNTTYGANFAASIQNNCFDAAGTQVRLPAGKANDAAYQVRGNRMVGPSYIGATAYADVDAFEAAHSAATGNFGDEPMLSESLVPLPGSPLLNGGIDLGPRRGIRGFQSRKHIGAYGPARMRRT